MKQLDVVFYERGTPEELLKDNDIAFRSRLFADFARIWSVHLRFRCARWQWHNQEIPSNSEGHRREKRMYLYNLRPQDDLTSSTAPMNMLYQYQVRVHEVDPCEECEPVVENPYQTEDTV